MLSLRASLAVAAAICLSAAGGSLAAQPQDRVLQGRELVALYQNMTWAWKDGAAFFSPTHEFKAVGQSSGTPTRASGSWAVNDQGVMCFSATWTGGKWRKWDRTCFEHRIQAGALRQRRLPNGTWYAFRSEPEREGDEVRRFTAGEHLTTLPKPQVKP